MSSKSAELELLISYSHLYLNRVDLRSNYKPLRQLLTRPLDKAAKILENLHEDLRHDYSASFEQVVQEAGKKANWINIHDYV